MQQMQCYQFKSVILSLIFLLYFAAFVSAGQQFEVLYKLYEQNDFDKLRQKVEELSGTYPDALETRFFKALFISNGENAKKHYLYVFEQGKGKIKIFAAKKLMDYFFAKGYYVNASKYQKYLVETERNNDIIFIASPKPEDNSVQSPKEGTEQYYIQVGAFSNNDNARQMCDMLATQNIETKIVKRKIKDQNLFCVWIEGKNDFYETLKLANKIKEKYDLPFRIIKK